MATATKNGKIDLAQVDFDGLTFGEIEDLEEVTSMDFDEITELLKAYREAPVGEKPRFPAKLATATVYIALKRQNPATTIEDARSIAVMDIKFASGGRKNPPARQPLAAMDAGRAPRRRTPKAS